MITNINYRGQLVDGEVTKISFPENMKSPVQRVFNTTIGTMIVFRSGKFRLMGVKSENVDFYQLPLLPEWVTLQSATATGELGRSVNLYHLATALTYKRCRYDPELFPAARLVDFNPICINIFSSGKIVMMGIKDLSWCSPLLANVIAIIDNISPL
jgi:TATA-box binding protein (TBP) (component of TFIID and TFIIIB)